MALNNYTLDDIFTSVKRQFGDESGVQITDDDITRWANQACMEINSKNKVLRKETYIALSNKSRVDSPDDSLIVLMVRYKETSSDDHGPILKNVPVQDIYYISNPNSRKGTPTVWAIEGNSIVVDATPDSIYSGLNVHYIPEPERMISKISTIPLPDRYYDRIIEFVLSKAYELDEDWQAQQVQKSSFESSLMMLNHAETDTQGPFSVVTNVDEW